jgi:hypothetical protein
LARRDLGIGAAVVLVGKDIGALDSQFAAGGHGVTRIDGEIDQRRLEMVRVDLDVPEAGRADGLDLDVLAQRALDEVGGAHKELVDVEQFRIEGLPPGERQQTARQRGGALRAPHSVRQRAIETRVGCLLGGLALRCFQIADHDHQEIVEVVGDAAAQLADRLHLL